MESGLWYVFLFNDGIKPQKIAFVGSQYGKIVLFIASFNGFNDTAMLHNKIRASNKVIIKLNSTVVL